VEASTLLEPREPFCELAEDEGWEYEGGAASWEARILCDAGPGDGLLPLS